jgi:hypothetical protein
LYISTNNIATGMAVVASSLSIHQKYVFSPRSVKNCHTRTLPGE